MYHSSKSRTNQISLPLLVSPPEIGNRIFKIVYQTVSIWDRAEIDRTYPPFDWRIHPGGAPIPLTCRQINHEAAYLKSKYVAL